MRLTDDLVRSLTDVICGNSEETHHRGGSQLVEFFNRHGETDLYGQGFPSRYVYARDKLISLNGSSRMKEVMEDAFNTSFKDDIKAEDAAYQFTKRLVNLGYKLAKRIGDPFCCDGAYHYPSPTFEVITISRIAPTAPEFLMSDEALSGYVSTARARTEQSDYVGAISICYTLIEGFLKNALCEASIEFNSDEGDVRRLYRICSKFAGLDLTEDTPDPLKPLLSGLTTLVGGFYLIANKAGDRHQSQFRPNAQHARLVVSLTFAFCEFLVDSRKQRERLKLSA